MMGAAALLMLRASSGEPTRVLVGSSAMAEAEANERTPKMAARVMKDFMAMTGTVREDVWIVLEQENENGENR